MHQGNTANRVPITPEKTPARLNQCATQALRLHIFFCACAPMFVPAQKFGTFSQFLVPSYQKLSVPRIEAVRSPGAHIVSRDGLTSDLRIRLRRAQVQFLDAVPKRQYVDAGSRETASAESVVQKTSGPSQEGPPECILPVPTSRDRVPLPYVAGTQVPPSAPVSPAPNFGKRPPRLVIAGVPTTVIKAAEAAGIVAVPL